MSYNYYTKHYKRNVSDRRINKLCAMFEKLSLNDTPIPLTTSSRKRKAPEPEKCTCQSKRKPTYKNISLHEALKMKIKEIIIVTEEPGIEEPQISKKRKSEDDDIQVHSDIYERFQVLQKKVKITTVL